MDVAGFTADRMIDLTLYPQINLIDFPFDLL